MLCSTEKAPVLRWFNAHCTFLNHHDEDCVIATDLSSGLYVLGQRFATALLPRLFRTNPRSHHKGTTGRILTGDQLHRQLCDMNSFCCHLRPAACLHLDNFSCPDNTNRTSGQSLLSRTLAVIQKRTQHSTQLHKHSTQLL